MTLPRPSEYLDVDCWCRAKIVQVPQHDILNRRTGECGPGCKDIYDRIQAVRDKARSAR